MLDTKMEKALNKQINAELYSAYLYLAMAGDFADRGMPGGQNWMTVQAQEEISHGMKIYDFVVERGGRVKLTAIAAPQGSGRRPRRCSKTRSSTNRRSPA